jgi:hypothetical protein
VPPPSTPKRSFINQQQLIKSLTDYEQNHLITFLLDRCPTDVVQQLVRDYFLGTINTPWPGSTVFWQVDGLGRIRSGKVMQYDPQTGKRVKKPESRVAWMHKVLKLEDFHLDQVFFGAHLLPLHPRKPVGVVESEKTALVCAACYPERIWLATGGLRMVTPDRCRILAGRQVEFFPDAGCYSLWMEKVNAINTSGNFVLSVLLEEVATPGEREAGFDLADYLLRYNYSDFAPGPAPGQVAEEEILPLAPEPEESPVKTFDLDEILRGSLPAVPVPPLPLWDVEGMESFFAGTTLPETARLDSCTTITDPELFVRRHLGVITHNNGTRYGLPYFERLQKLKDQLNPPPHH